MRKFLVLLSNIGRFLMFFEKSLATGHEEELLKELKENQIECKKLKDTLRKENTKGMNNG